MIKDYLAQLCLVIAMKMPRDLVYWCAIRLFAHATTGEYRSQEPDTITLTQALKAWRQP